MEENHKFVYKGRQSWLTNLTWPELGTAQLRLVEGLPLAFFQYLNLFY
jgi:hypothetical protein